MSLPSNVLNAQGLSVATQQQLSNYFTTLFKGIYGVDVNLSSNSSDAQWLNIIIQAILDVQEVNLQNYNSSNLMTAIGTALDQQVARLGLQRQGGTYTTTNITLVLTQSVNLYGLDQTAQAVFTVSDNAGNQYQLITSQLGVGPGTVVYIFEAVNIGAVQTTPNTITVPVTIILGVQSINNPTAASTTGINQETDAVLRQRALQSVSNVSQGYLQGLKGTIENINGITSAFVYENIGSTTDANGVPGHSIWVIIAGTPAPTLASAWSSLTTYSYGQIASVGSTNYISWQNNNINNNPTTATLIWGVYNPVAQAIYQKRNAGCGMFGAVNYFVTQIDGSSFIVAYDTVVVQNLYIAFTATSINGINQPNIASIRAGLVTSFVPGVNQEVNINALATAVQAIDPNCLVTNAGFSLATIQILTLSGVAASGAFVIQYNGNNSASIAWNDSAATIQTKLQAISGLSAATVSGSIAGQSLTVTLNVTSTLTLLRVTTNTLMTSAPAAITFSYNEGYSNTLSPATKKNQFAVTAANIIITPMILTPTTVSVARTMTQAFVGVGGYGTLVYSLQTNVSGGSINSSTGLYTAGSSTGTDIALITDNLGNTATATITVT